MTATTTYFLLLFLGFFAGIVVTYILLRLPAERNLKALRNNYDGLNNKLRETQTTLTIAENNTAHLQETLETTREELKQALSENNTLKQASAQKETENKHLQQRFREQQEEAVHLRKQFQTEFENIASKLLKSNTKEFAETNQKRLDEILTPFKERIEKV
ncbi:MAG: hypothetical protein U5L09_10780 [Bacteroidales bacterium]|nr:hypothetical protein [Bacteroidales bacterium]